MSFNSEVYIVCFYTIVNIMHHVFKTLDISLLTEGEIVLQKMNAAKMVAIVLAVAILLGPIPQLFAFQVAEAAQEEIFFTVLHTNDEHATLIPTPLVDYQAGQEHPSLGGFARLAQVVSQIRQDKANVNEDVLLVSAGDYIGGSPFSWLALQGQAPELSLLLELSYDVITIGNHEYDYGADVLATYLQAAGYPHMAKQTPIVASNTHIPTDHPLADCGISNTYIKELDNGLKVGFFGLLGEHAITVAPNAEPVTFGDQHLVAAESVNELQQAGADVIIAISHSGVDEDEELAHAVNGIDVIIGGHSHTELPDPKVVGDTIITQAGSMLKNLGVLELAYDQQSKTVRLRNDDQAALVRLDHQVSEQEQMSSLVDYYQTQLNTLIAEMTETRFNTIDEVVAHADFSLSNKPPYEESGYGNFITDAMRIIGQEALGAKVDFAFQANGVIRGSLNPGTMPFSEGQVKLYDLVTTVGLGSGPDYSPGYPLVSVYLTGQEVRRVLEISVLLSELMGDTFYLQASGLRATYDPGRAILMKVPIIDTPIPTTRAVLDAEKYTGEGIQDDELYQPLTKKDDQLYHVVTDYYIASFLPMVGDMLPSLGLVIKDEQGNPVESVEERIVYRNGQELKVWQTVLEYAASQPQDEAGNPTISNLYAQPYGRLTKVQTIPLLLWLVLAILVLIGVIVWVVRRLMHNRSR